jgi:SAM-dependent methyltransferase
MLSQADLERYYDASYQMAEPSFPVGGSSLWDPEPGRAAAQFAFAATVIHASTGRWLDIGAGFGFLLDRVRREGFETGAVEPAPDRASFLALQGHKVFPDIQSAGSDWDMISLSHCLEHIPDPVGFLRLLRAGLSPSGMMLCEVPNDEPGTVRKIDEPHVVFFGKKSLTFCAERAGLAVLSLREAGPRIGTPDPSVVVRRMRSFLPESVARVSTSPFWYGRNRYWLRALFVAASI